MRASRVRASVTVAPITRTIRGIPVEVPLDRDDGMPAACVVNLDDILTVPKSLLLDHMMTLSDEQMARVARAIAYALDLKLRT